MGKRLVRIGLRSLLSLPGLLPFVVLFWRPLKASVSFGRGNARETEELAVRPVEPAAAQPAIDQSALKRLAITGFRVFNVTTNLALVALLVSIIVVLVAPQFTGWRYGILRSGSMSPAMPTGAAIVVAPAGVADVHVGDVITFHSDVNHGLLVSHRVYAIKQTDDGRTAFETKGDANKLPDGTLVTPDRLVGKVIFSVAGVGRIAQNLHSRQAFYLLIAIPTVLIILFELKELASGVRDLRRPKKLEAQAE